MGLINKPCVAILASSWLGLYSCTFVMAVLNFFFFLILILCFYIYIYILVIGNIMNKSLLCRLRLFKTCYYSVKLQQYFLYKSGFISHLLYT